MLTVCFEHKSLPLSLVCASYRFLVNRLTLQIRVRLSFHTTQHRPRTRCVFMWAILLPLHFIVYIVQQQQQAIRLTWRKSERRVIHICTNWIIDMKWRIYSILKTLFSSSTVGTSSSAHRTGANKSWNVFLCVCVFIVAEIHIKYWLCHVFDTNFMIHIFCIL